MGWQRLDDHTTGDLGADFDTFYRAERDELGRMLAMALADERLGFEAVDEAMVRAFRDWPHVRALDRPAGWVYRVGLNWARSRLRRRRTRRDKAHLVVADERHLDQPRDPEIAAALAALDTDRRAVVVLRFYADWSIPEIAEALGVPPGTAKSRLHRALTDLNRALTETEVRA